MNTYRKIFFTVLIGASSLCASFSATGTSIWDTTIHLQKANSYMANTIWHGLTALYKSDVYDILSYTDMYGAYKNAESAKVELWSAYVDAPVDTRAKSYAYQAWLYAKNATYYLYNVYRRVDVNASILKARDNARGAQLYGGYAMQAISLRK
jgi:hypothetical protein